MTYEKKRDEAADRIVIETHNIDKDDVGEFATDINLVRKGMDWEHERAKVLICALKTLLEDAAQPVEMVGFFIGDDTLVKAQQALKQYERGE